MENKRKPNIVFILSDDQGTWSLGSNGNQDIISPTLDSMAEQGASFENFYCTCPVCSPARASILTGKMPSAHGVVDWLAGGSITKDDFAGIKINYKKSIPYLEEKPDNIENIPDDAEIGYENTTNYTRFIQYEGKAIEYLRDQKGYTEVLKENGYRCGISGKWHLGDSKNPQKGFDFWRVNTQGGGYYMLPEVVVGGKVDVVNKYVTDLITDDALEFLDSCDENPFYLSVHYTAPHMPWKQYDQPAEVWDLYNDCEFKSIPNLPMHEWQMSAAEYKTFSPQSEEERREAIQGYFTTLTAMDQNIGRLVNSIEEKGMMEDTIFIFTSDNGFNLGHHGIWGKGNATMPLNMYETSVKVPLIVWGKDITKGKQQTRLFSQYDLFPTILDLAGVSEKEIMECMENLPGRSFKNTLQGKESSEEESIVIYDEYGPARMIREGDYKLVYRYPYGPHELYNLTADPGEEKNLIDDDSHRSKKIELLRKMESWFKVYASKQFNTLLYPIDGNGQLDEIQNYTTDEKVFRSF